MEETGRGTEGGLWGPRAWWETGFRAERLFRKLEGSQGGGDLRRGELGHGGLRDDRLWETEARAGGLVGGTEKWRFGELGSHWGQQAQGPQGSEVSRPGGLDGSGETEARGLEGLWGDLRHGEAGAWWETGCGVGGSSGKLRHRQEGSLGKLRH